MSGHSPGFETVVTTENVAMGVQTVTTQHENGHVDHVDTPIVSHDEPVDDGVVSATVTVEFDFVEDDGTAAGQGEGALSPNDPEGFIDDNSPTNPYLAAIGAHSPSGNAIADNGNGQSGHYLDALGVTGSTSNDEMPLDPATFDDLENAPDPSPDASSTNAETDLNVDDPIVPLPEDDDPSTNSG
jgi:hypothetical protein